MSSGKIAVFLFIALMAPLGRAENRVCIAPDGHRTLTNQSCKAPYLASEEPTNESATKKTAQPQAKKLVREKEKLARLRQEEMERKLEKRK